MEVSKLIQPQQDIQHMYELLNKTDFNELRQIEYVFSHQECLSQSSSNKTSNNVSQFFHLLSALNRRWSTSQSSSTTQGDRTQQQSSSYQQTMIQNSQQLSQVSKYRQHILNKIFKNGLQNQIESQKQKSQNNNVKKMESNRTNFEDENQKQINQIMKKYQNSFQLNQQYDLNTNRKMKSKNEINFNSSGITNEELHIVLNGRPFLQTLNLMNCFSIQQLKLNNFCNLKQINLHQSKIKCLYLKRIPCLTDLSLYQCVEISYIRLEQCEKFSQLYINISKNIKLQFIRMKKLQNIHLKECKLIKSFSSIDCCPLKQLSLSSSQLNNSLLNSDNCFIVNLQKLYIYQYNLIKQISDTFRICSKLKIILFLSIRFQSEQLSNILKQYQQLTQVQIKYCNIKGKMKIQNLVKLKQLDLDHSKFQHLELKKLINLQYFHSQFQSIEQLILIDCDKLSRLDLLKMNIKKLQLNNLQNMHKIDLQASQYLKQVSLINCNKIQKIIVECKQLNMQNFLKDLQKLENLSFLTIKGLKYAFQITKFQNLKYLFFERCVFSLFLISQLPSLQNVSIFSSKYQKEALFQIKNCSLLKKIQMNYCTINKKVSQKLRQYKKITPQVEIKAFNIKQTEQALYRMDYFNYIEQVLCNQNQMNERVNEQNKKKLINLNGQQINQSKKQIRDCLIY